MKIVRVTVEGELTPGDVLLVHTMDPRGGRTTGGTIVEKDRAEIAGDGVVRVSDTVEMAVVRLADSCRNQFPKEAFGILVKGNAIRFECQDSVTAVIFAVEVQGAKTERMSVEEF